jgi:uncharacterized protein YjbJ (UPF0337 family)
VYAQQAKEVFHVSKSDKAKNTAQAAKGKTKATAGKVFGDRSTQVEGGAEKRKASLKQAGEKLKDTVRK